MALSSIPSLVNRPAAPAATPAPNGGAGRAVVERAPARPAAVTYTPSSRPLLGGGAAPAAGAALPEAAPAGTDPALWSVLTDGERTFLAKAATLGPLTYGPAGAGAAAAAPAARGGRLDVRA